MSVNFNQTKPDQKPIKKNEKRLSIFESLNIQYENDNYVIIITMLPLMMIIIGFFFCFFVFHFSYQFSLCVCIHANVIQEFVLFFLLSLCFCLSLFVVVFSGCQKKKIHSCCYTIIISIRAGPRKRGALCKFYMRGLFLSNEGGP